MTRLDMGRDRPSPGRLRAGRAAGFLVLAAFASGLMACAPHDHSSDPWRPPDVDPAKAWDIDASSNVYTHRSSGLRFPERLGDFARGRTLIHSDTGREVSVGYALVGQAQVTIYTMSRKAVAAFYSLDAADLSAVYDRYYKSCLAQIVEGDDRQSTADDALLIEQTPVTIEPNGGAGPVRGMRALFNAELKDMEVGTAFFLFVLRDYLIEVRATYPRAERDAALSKTNDLLRGLFTPASP